MAYVNNIQALALATLAVFMTNAQEQRNHIRTDVMLDSYGLSRMTKIEYYDGLGRLEQTVDVGASPSGADLIVHNSRDRAGRIIRQFNATPYSGNGNYVDGCQICTIASDAYQDANPYTLSEYEQSPFGRLKGTTGAGQAWHSVAKSAKKTFLTNSTSGSELKCRMFSVCDTRNASDTVVSVTADGVYPNGALLVTKAEDEDGHTSLIFIDGQNRTILTRERIDNGYADTYYVYDMAGNLTAVLPPAFSASVGNGAISSASADARNLAYFYIYDWHGRCRAKKLPGRDWQITVYDKAGKALMKQDGNMRKRGEAVFSLSDAYGRKCVTGVTNKTLSLSEANDACVLVRRSSATDSLGGYEIMDNAVTLPSDNLLSVTYYDDYSFLVGKEFGQELAYRKAADYDSRYECANYPAFSARGLLTGTATRILGDSVMLFKSVYYDYHGNVIQSHEQNAMGGYDHYYYRLSFTGKPIAIRHEHSSSDAKNVYVYSYTYDNMERLLSVSLAKDGGNPATLARNTYDEFGHLQNCRLGQSMEGIMQFRYNIRGWTKQIISPHFSQELYYECNFGNSEPCYNGNISAIEWKSKDTTIASTIVSQAYEFFYDGINRLESADYSSSVVPGAETAVGLTLLNERDYSCTYSYDLNGNISSLHRKGVCDVVTAEDKTMWTFGDIDKLMFTYNGNQLKKVVDQVEELTYAGAMDFKDHSDIAVEYAYDSNGNMTRDKNRRIHSITYNILNLPSEMMFNDGHIVRYTYDAAGTKLKVEYLLGYIRVMDDWNTDRQPGKDVGGIKGINGISAKGFGGIGDLVSPPGSGMKEPVAQMTLQYSAGHVYRNGKLERVDNPYGYWADGSFHYHITDYQGNIRAVIDEDGTLEEVNNYYPYGGLMGAGVMGVQPYKYGAKELDRENGLDLYDSKARWYDPMIGRTPTQDPLAEKYYEMSPYLWCAANPIANTDPTGMYFNSADSAQAAIYIKQLNQRIMLLNKSDAKDRHEQLSEVNKSIQDIEDMRNDQNRRYTFEEGLIEPEVTSIEGKTVLIRIDIGKEGSYAHEMRHGGQIARGEWDFEKGTPNNRYGASHEIDAYRAEYSAVGGMCNDCWVELFQMPMEIRVKTIKEINVSYLKRLYQNEKFLYGGFNDDWYKK